MEPDLDAAVDEVVFEAAGDEAVVLEAASEGFEAAGDEGVFEDVRAGDELAFEAARRAAGAVAHFEGDTVFGPDGVFFFGADVADGDFCTAGVPRVGEDSLF